MSFDGEEKMPSSFCRDVLTDVLGHKKFCIVVFSRVELKFPGGFSLVLRVVGIFVVVLYEDDFGFPR